MPKYTYKNNSDQEIVIPNHGVVAAGKTIDSEEPIENPNLEAVKKAKKDK